MIGRVPTLRSLCVGALGAVNFGVVVETVGSLD